MLVTLNFHPTLYKFTGGVKQHNIEITRLCDIKDALVVLFPKMRRYIHLIISNSLGRENLCLVKPDGTPVSKKEFEFNLIEDDEYTLCPIIAGGGGQKGLGILMIVAAIVLIAFSGGIASFIVGLGEGAAGMSATALAAAEAAVASKVIMAGISLALSGVMQLMAKPPKPPSSNTSNSSQQRRNNDMFDAMENTTDPNSSVALIYGLTRAPGQLLSGHVETMTHGESDTIYVRDLLHAKSSEITRVEGD